MFGRVGAPLRGALVACLLGSCSAVDSAIDPRYDTINRSTAKARNESILLNIVRASHAVPLNFVAFSRVSGATQIGGSVALPNFQIGPSYIVPATRGNPLPSYTPLTGPQRDVAFNKDNLGGSTSASNNFDISLLETKDFYQGLLRPVDLPILNYFIRQGYSRELLFWLFTESVRVTAMGRTIEFLNDPDERRSCDIVRGRQECFRHMVDVAMASGLTVETRIENKKSGGDAKGGGQRAKGGAHREDDSEKPEAGGKDEHPGKGEGKGRKGDGNTTNVNVNVEVGDKGGGGDSKGGGGKSRTLARFCFDPVLARRAHRDYGTEILEHLLTRAIAGHRPRCKDPFWVQNPDAETDTLVFRLEGTPFGTVVYEIIPRSTFGIYQFLGRILALNVQDTFEMRGSLDPTEDRHILTVLRDSSGGCFAEVAFAQEYYCVPLRGAENTKRIIGLLAQLIALNTNTLDLSITPSVRLSQ
jgi:hypothetical protein